MSAWEVWLKVSPELTGGQKAVYAELANHVQRNLSGAPSISTIARTLGLNSRSVGRAIAVLEQRGLIRVRRTIGLVSQYRAPPHPWMTRNTKWAEARQRAKRKQAATRAAARAGWLSVFGAFLRIHRARTAAE